MEELCFCMPGLESLGLEEKDGFSQICLGLITLGVDFRVLVDKSTFPTAAAEFLTEQRTDLLPVTTVGGRIITAGRIPTAGELLEALKLDPNSLDFLSLPKKKIIKGFDCALKNGIT